MKKFFLITCILFFTLHIHVHAQYVTAKFPRIGLNYDFNITSKDLDAYGPRVQVFSKDRKIRGTILTYLFGLGFGDYKVKQIKDRDRDTYHIYGMLSVNYKNPSSFEPFVGIYPGVAWGGKKGFFANPITGVNITAFHINRNWNSKLLQTYVQLHAEYNTLFTELFLGGGIYIFFY